MMTLAALRVPVRAAAASALVKAAEDEGEWPAHEYHDDHHNYCPGRSTNAQYSHLYRCTVRVIAHNYNV